MSDDCRLKKWCLNLNLILLYPKCRICSIFSMLRGSREPALKSPEVRHKDKKDSCAT